MSYMTFFTVFCPIGQNTVKKVSDFPITAGMSITKLSLANLFFTKFEVKKTVTYISPGPGQYYIQIDRVNVYLLIYSLFLQTFKLNGKSKVLKA